jgi:uncharacterized protein involved in cysteine biosynthesis
MISLNATWFVCSSWMRCARQFSFIEFEFERERAVESIRTSLARTSTRSSMDAVGIVSLRYAR